MAVDTQPGSTKDTQSAAVDATRRVSAAGTQASPQLRVVARRPSRQQRLADPAVPNVADRLRTARGILLGLAISLVGWSVIVLLWWLLH